MNIAGEVNKDNSVDVIDVYNNSMISFKFQNLIQKSE